jgi:hypothetical protein
MPAMALARSTCLSFLETAARPPTSDAVLGPKRLGLSRAWGFCFVRQNRKPIQGATAGEDKVVGTSPPRECCDAPSGGGPSSVAADATGRPMMPPALAQEQTARAELRWSSIPSTYRLAFRSMSSRSPPSIASV